MFKQLILLICLPACVVCQNTIGFPDVTNYSKQVYGAGLQNWDIKQDKNGLLYAANNEGLLIFDGKNWNLYPLPNKTIVRSIEIGKDNRIYVGGQDEMGYFVPGQNGRLQYHSLTQFIPEKNRSFGDVWDIISNNNELFFRSSTIIFKFANEAVTVYNAPSEWAYLGLFNSVLYAHDYKTGLMKFENEGWSPVFFNNQLPVNDPVTAILPMQKDSAMVTTLKNGLYILSKSGISKLPAANNTLFENERIYAATSINTEWIALATNNNGVYIIDLKGNIIQSFSRTEGLQNNNVLSIFLDRQSNLWLGLDDGIDLIAYNSAIKQINPFSLNGSGYAAIIFDNKLYLGTTNGLYSVALQDMNDLSFSKGNFAAVNNIKGQTWSLAKINNQLLVGHHEGAFIINNNTATQISSEPGFWNFLPLSGIFPSSQMLGGNYKGIEIFNYKNRQFITAKMIPGFKESSRFIALDKDDNIWVSHPYHRVYKIVKNTDSTYTAFAYDEKKGLPSQLNNHVYKINNEVVFATEKGIFIYNSSKDIFEQSPYYKNILGDQSIRYLKQDPAGNTWFIHEKNLGVIDISGKEPFVTYLPELNNKMLSGFEYIYPVNQNNIFLGGENGFYHINYEKYKRSVPAIQVQVRAVRIFGKTDSIVFAGYFKGVNDLQVQNTDSIPEIDYSFKTIRFEYSTALFGFQANLDYSFRLKGLEENWSAWTKRTEKEYTTLPPGTYTFEVKVRSNLGNESPIAVYSFKILPPWYKSKWAYLLYILLFVLSLYIMYKWQQKKFILQKTKHEEEQKSLQYIYELERNKAAGEIIALQNEKLEVEINFKNSELASSAMHLVKKSELLSKIKGDLTQVMKGVDSAQSAAEFKKLIKTLSEDDNIDKEWEHFAKHFDKVHSDFLVELKEIHPAITPNELKLCAYLRMNLSTKEIAQLMNISVRGVEISRYRLRKKLQLSSEKSLFNYLISIKGTH